MLAPSRVPSTGCPIKTRLVAAGNEGDAATEPE